MSLLYGKIQLKCFELFALIKTPKNGRHNEKSIRAKLYCRVTNNPISKKQE